MLTPKYVQILDYSSFIGKTFVVAEDFNWLQDIGVSEQEYQDYSEYKMSSEEQEELEKRIFGEDEEMPAIQENIQKGSKIVINKIKKNKVKIQIIREGEALELAIREKLDELIKSHKHEIKVFDEIIKW